MKLRYSAKRRIFAGCESVERFSVSSARPFPGETVAGMDLLASIGESRACYRRRSNN
jgi:hypothetical protein